MISATKAGLSSPSISSVAVVTICSAPPDASSTEVRVVRNRTWDPTLTGLMKRTLLEP